LRQAVGGEPAAAITRAPVHRYVLQCGQRQQ
jgi:hypothetical protein